ncbi:MAG: hypothetical protein QM784_24620 [Polyangiaceae bacterium]
MRQPYLASTLALALLSFASSQVAFGQETVQEQPADPPRSSAPPPTAPATGSARNKEELPRFALALKTGLATFGSGLDRLECSGADCNGLAAGERDYQFRPSPVIALGAYYQPTALVRTGPALSYGFQQSVTFNSSNGHTELGNLLTLGFSLELTPRLSRKLWLVPELQLSYALLFPGGEFERQLDRWQTSCGQSFATFDCGSLKGSRSGFHAALGLGLLYAAAPSVRLRIDVLAEYYYFPLLDLSAANADIELTEHTSGIRQVLLAGLEF